MAVTALLKLAGFTNELHTVDIAHQALTQMQPVMSQYPLGFGQWLQALSYALSQPREIAIVGDPDSADTQALLSVARDGYRPFQVVALGSPDGLLSARERQLPSNTADAVGSIAAAPLLQDRGLVEGHAAAYVCRDFVCQARATQPEGLRAQLEYDRSLTPSRFRSRM
jgi:uncharacterized protein